MFKRFILFLFLPLIGIQSVKATDIYVKVTSSDDLIPGAKYILAATSSKTTYVATGFGNYVLNTVTSGFSVKGSTITITTATPLEFVLGVNEEGYTLQNGADNYLGYANLTSSKYALENVSSGLVSDKETWIFNSSSQLIPYVYGERQLGFSGSDIKAILTTVVGNTAYLYKKVSTVTLAAACTDGAKFYGTFSLASPFVVPSDLTVSEIKVTDGKLTVGNYATGAVVPANTGVMVSSTTSGDHYVTLTTTAGSSLFGSDNMLMPSGNGITTAEMAEAAPGCKYYRLTMHNGTTLGYYWGAADGAAFDLGANKAYLAVPIASARLTGFDMADSETTDIRVKGIVNSERQRVGDGTSGMEFAAAAVYDLQGRRVADSSLKKGLYIVNGKKYIIK